MSICSLLFVTVNAGISNNKNVFATNFNGANNGVYNDDNDIFNNSNSNYQTNNFLSNETIKFFDQISWCDSEDEFKNFMKEYYGNLDKFNDAFEKHFVEYIKKFSNDYDVKNLYNKALKVLKKYDKDYIVFLLSNFW